MKTLSIQLVLVSVLALFICGKSYAETCKGGWPGEDGIPVLLTIYATQSDGTDWESVVKVPVEEILSVQKLEFQSEIFDLVFSLDMPAVEKINTLQTSFTESGATEPSLVIDVCDEPFSISYRPALVQEDGTLRIFGDDVTWGLTSKRADELIAGVGLK